MQFSDLIITIDLVIVHTLRFVYFANINTLVHVGAFRHPAIDGGGCVRFQPRYQYYSKMYLWGILG